MWSVRIGHGTAGQCVLGYFQREEDATLHSGKLDEELKRMSAIVDRLESQSLLLCNESFASTNEREGSQIARQSIRALLEHEIKVFYVTHLFDLADSLRQAKITSELFLRAQRLPDGRRTFRIEVGDPLPTSYGKDLYRRIFADEEAGQGHAITAAPVHETLSG